MIRSGHRVAHMHRQLSQATVVSVRIGETPHGDVFNGLFRRRESRGGRRIGPGFIARKVLDDLGLLNCVAAPRARLWAWRM